jgi:hypothetical protein
MKMCLVDVPKAFAAIEIDGDAKGQRMVQITMTTAKHLPKMDTFGSIDPYAIVSFEGMELRTKTVKNTYEPEWNETFEWYVGDVHKGCSKDLTVTIMDWDAGSKDDEVGSFTIPAARMCEIVRAKIGQTLEDTFTLFQGGKGVAGHDKQTSEVSMKISIVEVPDAFALLDIDEQATGQRRLQVNLVSANHLPKVMRHSFLSTLSLFTLFLCMRMRSLIYTCLNVSIFSHK